MEPVSRAELRWAAGWAAVVLAVTCLPYAVVWWYTPLGAVFPWTLFGADDHGVYYAWARQARDGDLLFRNLFTTEPQRGVSFHLYFLLLGWLSRLPGLDVPLACHLGRVLCGAGALVLVYRLAAFYSADLLARRCAFWIAAVGGGLGWLFWTDTIRQTEPVDVWQPEALISLSLYVNGLYGASLALMLGFVVCLLHAERHGARWVLGAGLCLLVLGNIHSYDVIHLALAWGLYLALRTVLERRLPWRALGQAALAGLVATPAVAYMGWLYLAEPVFRERADVPTRSGPLSLYLLGFGLLLPAALAGLFVLRRQRSPDEEGAGPPALLPAWALAGIAAAYLPFAFQRKMIMGAEIPLVVLAGLGVAAVAQAGGKRLRLPPAVPAALLIAVLAVTPARFLVRDVRMALDRNLVSTQAHPAYWPEANFQVLAWLGANTPRDAAVLCFPLNGVFVPGFAGRSVYAGHFGETPRFAERFPEVRRFYARADGAERRAFIRRHGITHVLWGPAEREFAGPGARDPAEESFLREVFRAGETRVFAVQP
jgi:hypothetical protein